MNSRREIEINRFQLGVLLTGLDKNFYNCIIENNIYCSHCKSFAIRGIFVDTIFLTKLNDVKVYGRCKICNRSEEHTSELQSRPHLVCRLLLEKKKNKNKIKK